MSGIFFLNKSLIKIYKCTENTGYNSVPYLNLYNTKNSIYTSVGLLLCFYFYRPPRINK